MTSDGPSSLNGQVEKNARFRQKIRATDQPDRPRHALKMQIRDVRGRGDAERRIPRRRKPRAHGCREKPPELRRHVLSGCEGRLARDGLPGREGLWHMQDDSGGKDSWGVMACSGEKADSAVTDGSGGMDDWGTTPLAPH